MQDLSPYSAKMVNTLLFQAKGEDLPLVFFCLFVCFCVVFDLSKLNIIGF